MFSHHHSPFSLFVGAMLFAAAGFSPASGSTPGDSALAEGIRALEEETGGTFGVSVRHITRGDSFDHGSDVVFPAASVIKTHLLVLLQRMEERGELSLDETLVLTDEDKVGGSGRLQNEEAGEEYTLKELAHLMIVISDNTATNMLMRRMGGIDAINGQLRDIGIETSRFGRYMMDFEARERGIDNWLTAPETAQLYVAIELGTATGTPEGGQAVLDVLLAQELQSRMPVLLPEGTRVAHKTGSLAAVCHDSGIIYAPSGPIALAVLTKGIEERSVAVDAIRKIALLVYDEWGTVEEAETEEEPEPED